MRHLTKFQKRIIVDLERAGNSSASTWQIAWEEFPQEWVRRASRGAIISNIVRAGYFLESIGLVQVLPPKNRHSHHRLYLRQENWVQYNKALNLTIKT